MSKPTKIAALVALTMPCAGCGTAADSSALGVPSTFDAGADRDGPDSEAEVDMPDAADAFDVRPNDGTTVDQAVADTTGCPPGLEVCGAECVDVAMDGRNCGTCGLACGDGERCCHGSCAGVVRGAAPPLARLDDCGFLSYGTYANHGESNADNILPDFSFAGYERGGIPIPDVSVVRTVQPGPGDDLARIQQAIDETSAMPLDGSGFRGAVLLSAGHYEIADSIVIEADGVVLRGAGQGLDGTVIELRGKGQKTAIRVEGAGSGLGEVAGTRRRVTTAYVAVGARAFDVESVSGLAVGDDVAVLRTPNQAWIDALKMAPYGWTPESFAIAHERRIVALDGQRVTVDIPLVDTVEDRFGGGVLFKTRVKGRIRHCGVEDLRLESTWADETDEDHGWTAVRLSRVTDSWVRRVTARFFGYSAVLIENASNFNTVEETAMLDPKSKITGGRRYPFHVAGGMGNLFQRCYARGGRHNFVSGSRVTGPNVWLDCAADENHADDGPHHRWATGLLFDNTSSSELHVQNRKDAGSGHGWAGAQVLFWNADASELICDAPTGAMNYAVGCVGARTQGSWAPEEPFGIWESLGANVQPRSLYLQQLQDRLGPAAVMAVTVPAQRTGEIFDALRSWAGEGRLADHL